MRLLSMILRLLSRLLRSFINLLFFVVIDIPLAILMLIFSSLRHQIKSLSQSYNYRIMAFQASYLEFEKELTPRQQIYMEQNNLAIAYGNRIRGDKTEALKVFTFNDFPEDWAGMMNNLATTYHDRIRGDKADNLEQAIIFYQEALKVYTVDAFPENWAMTQNNLGNVYRDRIRKE